MEQDKITNLSEEDQKAGGGVDKMFFNVMPKAGGSGGLVQAEIKIQEAETRNDQPKKEGFLKKIAKYKLYLIIGAIVVIGAPVIYFLANIIAQKSYKPQSLLTKNPPVVRKTSTTTPVVVSPPTGTADFTTPQSWRNRYFPSCADKTLCGDDADPDHDGLTNLDEYNLHTDPNNADSDQDGLADGDEVHVFGTDPLNAHTAGNSKYSDTDFFRGGFDISTNKKLSAAQISDFAKKMQTFGLHQPTITTLGNILNSLYGFTPPQTGGGAANPASTSTPQSASTTVISGIDESASAKQSRDAQRSNTITNIEMALVKYYSDNNYYPRETDFISMVADIKPYLKIATDPIDPINSPPFVYSYTQNASSTDFDLSFYSETQSQLITKNAAAAQKDAGKEQADIYDNQREMDLQSLRGALLIYSNDNVAGNQTYVFPTVAKYKTAIVPKYLNQIPVDPKTQQDYAYQVSANFSTFTIKTLLDDPPAGSTGYVCNQDSCQNY